MEIYDLEIKIKSYLNKNKIRLCDSPYTVNNKEGSEIKVLAERLSSEMKYYTSEIEKVLSNLRIIAIKNLNSIDKFKSESICLIKVYQPKSMENTTLEIQDFNNVSGYQFKSQIANLLFVPDNFIKVIFNGKLIKDDELLINQGLKNNSKVMVLHICQEDIKGQENCVNFGKSKDMAEYLAKRAVDGRFRSNSMNIEITNQSGEVLQLTNDQKSLLTYGLTMHQQAANYITNSKYQMALLHCLEADEAFQKSDYCDSIDNSAILQLDIVWCYYFLQNIDDLQNAKKRLSICEERMKKCYGQGNERIRRIREKKSFEGIPESIHVFRLYLLKAIIGFYENDVGNGREYLLMATDVFKSFIIPESLITEVMSIGFYRNQAIEGLRVSKEIPKCVEYILKREEDKKDLESKRMEEIKRKKIVKRLGYTENSSRINLDILERLIQQSCLNRALCLAAIRRANNNFTEAMDLLFNNEEQLLNDIKSQEINGIVTDGDISYEAVVREKDAVKTIRNSVKQDKFIVLQCLRQFYGNIEMALRNLDESHDVKDNKNPFVNADADDNANDNVITSSSSLLSSSSSSSSSTSSNISMNQIDDEPNAKELELEIYNSVGEGSSRNLENQYINPDLTNEILVFNKFARLLNISEITHDTNNNVVW